MHHFTFDQLAARIVFGAGRARTDLAGEISRLGAERVLVIASTRDAERVATLVEPLGDLVAGTFTAVREHVPLPTAEAARAAAARGTGRRGAGDRRWVDGRSSQGGRAHGTAAVVAVPTTYAGSEVTPVWGLTENGRKTTGSDPAVLPRVVVYDPELTATLPPRSRGRERVQRAGPRRRGDVGAAAQPRQHGRRRGGDRRGWRPDCRKDDPAELLCGAWLGASAFAVAGSGLHHKLCHVLGGTFDLPHARTHAVVLPHVLAFNAPGAPDAVRSGRPARWASPTGSRGLRALADEHGVPRGLRALGMPEDGIEKAAALTEPAVPEDNPVPVGDGALRRLVRAAWSGEDQ